MIKNCIVSWYKKNGAVPKLAQLHLQARVQGGAQGAWPPPKKKKGHHYMFKLCHLYFATFLVENVFFSASF